MLYCHSPPGCQRGPCQPVSSAHWAIKTGGAMLSAAPATMACGIQTLMKCCCFAVMVIATVLARLALGVMRPAAAPWQDLLSRRAGRGGIGQRHRLHAMPP